MPEASAEGLTIALVLLAALLHASWNALTKASGDPLVNVAVVAGTGGLCALPVLLAFPLPESETWIWLSCSAVIHFAYQLSLVRSYQLGDLGQVYPIARGLAPLGVACLAAVWAGESLHPIQVVGLLLASGAIISLGTSGLRSGPSTRGAVFMAVATAILIGAYTFSDGRGVRSVSSPLQFIGWSFFLGCVPMCSTTLWLRHGTIRANLRRDGLRAFGGGLMATLGYGIALWAISRASMASVASLRESSVLFAAILGSRLLGESFGRRRIWSAVVLVAGLVLVQLRPR